ncbi:MAG: hypothetical protein WC382_03210 [Methanoregulaceae archaeon]
MGGGGTDGREKRRNHTGRDAALSLMRGQSYPGANRSSLSSCRTALRQLRRSRQPGVAGWSGWLAPAPMINPVFFSERDRLHGLYPRTISLHYEPAEIPAFFISQL